MFGCCTAQRALQWSLLTVCMSHSTGILLAALLSPTFLAAFLPARPAPVHPARVPWLVFTASPLKATPCTPELQNNEPPCPAELEAQAILATMHCWICVVDASLISIEISKEQAPQHIMTARGMTVLYCPRLHTTQMCLQLYCWAVPGPGPSWPLNLWHFLASQPSPARLATLRCCKCVVGAKPHWFAQPPDHATAFTQQHCAESALPPIPTREPGPA